MSYSVPTVEHPSYSVPTAPLRELPVPSEAEDTPSESSYFMPPELRENGPPKFEAEMWSSAIDAIYGTRDDNRSQVSPTPEGRLMRASRIAQPTEVMYSSRPAHQAERSKPQNMQIVPHHQGEEEEECWEEPRRHHAPSPWEDYPLRPGYPPAPDLATHRHQATYWEGPSRAFHGPQFAPPHFGQMPPPYWEGPPTGASHTATFPLDMFSQTISAGTHRHTRAILTH